MNKRILAIGAHTDDIELGCGGSLSRFVSEGSKVISLCFSIKNPDYPHWKLDEEFHNSMESIGIVKNKHFQYPMRNLDTFRQRILDDLYRFKDIFKPDFVFCPSLHDIHGDHNTVAQQALRAFKDITVFGYELPWNNINFQTQAFIRLELTHLDKKMKALACYESQAHKPYMSPLFVESLARTRGVQIGIKYAEAFEVIRCLID